MRHIIDPFDITMDEWEALYASARDIMARPSDYAAALSGKVMASLFYEPSTRTNFSFQTAMLRLGGTRFGFSNPVATSVSKGESLKDTVRMCSSYGDALVIRNPREGAALAASMYSSVPVINCGDGGHLHPTQTLADLTTIMCRVGRLNNLNVGLCGDLKNGRTVHSLIKFLSRVKGVFFYLIAPRHLAIPDYLRAFMVESGAKFVEVTGLEATIGQLDVLYMTRIQRERFVDQREYERSKGIYVLSADKLRGAKKELMIMHPLPRVDEIAVDVDSDPRAAYFDTVMYGMYIRMALLLKLCGMERVPDSELNAYGEGAAVCRNPICITQTERYLPRLTKESASGQCCAYCDKPVVG